MQFVNTRPHSLSCRAQSKHLNISRLDFSTTLRFGRNDREIAF